ncbi:MAG: recombination protein RecR [Flavobacteriaceae bacterium]|nr:MAG: recombination protein RecR [Flavobacteriaceae bacterium]
MQALSKVLNKAIEEISSLPGIGKSTAIRLALFMLDNPKSKTEALSKALFDLVNEINYCQKCHVICDEDICSICQSNSRDQSLLCVVEDIRDVIALEKSGGYSGLYHVLGGKISPMEGIGPSELNIATFEKKILENQIKEVIFALSSTLEGDTTMFYLYKIIPDHLKTKTTTIARGISVGNQLEYTDQVTLAKSIENRVPYKHQ